MKFVQNGPYVQCGFAGVGRRKKFCFRQTCRHGRLYLGLPRNCTARKNESDTRERPTMSDIRGPIRIYITEYSRSVHRMLMPSIRRFGEWDWKNNCRKGMNLLPTPVGNASVRC